jgi:hypothetical protein
MGMIRFLLAVWVVVVHRAPLFGVLGPRARFGFGYASIAF